MKRFVTIMIVLLCFVSAITVYADFINPTITDSVGYLTEEQNKELSEGLIKFVNNIILTSYLFQRIEYLPMTHKRRQTTFTIIMATVTVKIMTEYFFI